MSNQAALNALNKLIRAEDGFIIRAAKCAGVHMEYSAGFDNEEKFLMSTVERDKDEDGGRTALIVSTDAFEYLDVLLACFLDSVEPFGDGSTDVSVEHSKDDLLYLCRAYEREKAKGPDVGYMEVTFLIDRDSTKIDISNDTFSLTVDNLNWCGDLFMTK
jgi:hypothetical protein